MLPKGYMVYRKCEDHIVIAMTDFLLMFQDAIRKYDGKKALEIIEELKVFY